MHDNGLLMSIRTTNKTCMKCGGLVVATRIGDFEEIRCQGCGWNVQSLVYPRAVVPLIDGSDKLVDVRIEWACAEPTIDELMAARRVIPILAKTPMQTFFAQARNSTTYELGRLPLALAIDLQEQAKSNGIRVVVTGGR